MMLLVGALLAIEQLPIAYRCRDRDWSDSECHCCYRDCCGSHPTEKAQLSVCPYPAQADIDCAKCWTIVASPEEATGE